MRMILKALIKEIAKRFLLIPEGLWFLVFEKWPVEHCFSIQVVSLLANSLGHSLQPLTPTYRVQVQVALHFLIFRDSQQPSPKMKINLPSP
eukprot:scaffold23125_cov91-Cyclotella_meneghiniana.AAC.12